eukprot:6221783-Prymnesium_polylepis.1
MANGLPGSRRVVPMLCAHPDRARTALSPISSRAVVPVRKTALRTLNSRIMTMSVAGGAERD